MRIDLQFGGIAAGVSGLGQIAAGLEHVDSVYRSVRGSLRQLGGLSASVRFPTPTDSDTKRVAEYAQAWREVAKAQQGVSASAPKTSRPVATAPSVAASAPKTAVAAHTTATKAPSSVSSSLPAARFIKGPEQRLAEIAAQRQALPTITDPRQRARIEADLARAEFLAQRSIKLHERRMVNPAESLNRPGLLELFGELNSLVKHLATGNVVGVVKDLALGIKLVSDVGGLNVTQKVARSVIGNVGAGLLGTGGGGATGFNPNARGVFSLSQVQAGHAQIAKGAATSPGNLSQFVLPGSTTARIGNSRVLSGAVNAFSGIGRAVGQAVPAIGKVAASAGPLGAAFVGLAAVTGGLVLVVGAVALGLHLFTEGLKHAVEDLITFRAAMTQSGGNASSVAQLAAFGLAPDQIAGLGQSFRERTAAGSGDVFGQIGRARLGMTPTLGGPLGNPDTAGDLVRAIEGLRAISSPTERLRVARMTGTESLLGAAGASVSVFREMRQDAGVSASIRGDQQAGQDASDLAANGKRLFANLGAAVTAWMKPFIAPLSAFVGNLATLARFGAQHIERVSRIPVALGRVMGAVGKVFGSVISIVGKLSGGSVGNLMDKAVGGIVWGIEALANALTKFADGLPSIVGGVAQSVRGAGELISKLPGGGGVGGPLIEAADHIIRQMDELSRDSALRDNTDATKQLTDELRRAGTFGGGPRARAALGPSALTGEMRQRAIEANAIALGYWTL